jgi:hypothetical protein
VQKDRDDPQPLRQGEEHLVEPLGLGWVLGKLPWLLVLHVAVEALDPLPDLVERGRELHLIEAVAHSFGKAIELGQ